MLTSTKEHPCQKQQPGSGWIFFFTWMASLLKPLFEGVTTPLMMNFIDEISRQLAPYFLNCHHS